MIKSLCGMFTPCLQLLRDGFLEDSLYENPSTKSLKKLFNVSMAMGQVFLLVNKRVFNIALPCKKSMRNPIIL